MILCKCMDKHPDGMQHMFNPQQPAANQYDQCRDD